MAAPLLAAGSALSAASGFLKQVPKEVWIGAAVLGVGIFAYKTLKKGIQKAEYNHVINRIGKNSTEGHAASFADILFGAMFPSGQTFIPDGTNEKAIYQVASSANSKGVNFGDIATAYRKLFRRELQRDLQYELSNSERQKFYSLLQPLSNHQAPLL